MAVMLGSASRRLGRYELVSYLGSGGMSDVYVAMHTGLRKRFALKVLRPLLRGDESAVQRFLREGECAARVCHPNVVDVSDIGMEGEVPYLVMELLEGETLAGKLRREGPLPVERAVDILLPIFDAVAAVHAAGVLHRDIKPANIVLARAADGSVRPKLVDFGIACTREGTATSEPQATPIGTPYYMSPEQARGERVDERSDQYALASVLFELITGHEPYRGASVDDVLAQVARGHFPALSRVYSPALGSVLARATARHPAQRYGSVSDFAYSLVPFASVRTQKLWLSRDERAGLCSAQLLSGAFRPLAASHRLPAAPLAVEGRTPRTKRWASHWSLRALGGSALLGLGLLTGFGVTHGEAEAPKGSELRTSAVARAEELVTGEHVAARSAESQRAKALARLAESERARALTRASESERASARGPAAKGEAPRAEPRAPVQALSSLSAHRLHLVPAQASAALDGRLLGHGEVELPPLADSTHVLRVAAKGYVQRVVVFRDTLPETITLERRR